MFCICFEVLFCFIIQAVVAVVTFVPIFSLFLSNLKSTFLIRFVFICFLDHSIFFSLPYQIFPSNIITFSSTYFVTFSIETTNKITNIRDSL